MYPTLVPVLLRTAVVMTLGAQVSIVDRLVWVERRVWRETQVFKAVLRSSLILSTHQARFDLVIRNANHPIAL